MFGKLHTANCAVAVVREISISPWRSMPARCWTSPRSTARTTASPTRPTTSWACPPSSRPTATSPRRSWCATTGPGGRQAVLIAYPNFLYARSAEKSAAENINTPPLKRSFSTLRGSSSELNEPNLTLQVPSGQIGSKWEWYHWKALEKDINRYMFLIF